MSIHHTRQFSHVQLNKRNYPVPDMTVWHSDIEHQTIDTDEKQAKKYLWLFSSKYFGPYFQRTEDHWPVITYLILFVSLIVFSGELVFNRQKTGEFLELDPINYMLGPSVEIMIQSGARFTPCMRSVESMPPGEHYVCLQTIAEHVDEYKEPLLLLESIDDPILFNASCSLVSFCGMSGFQHEKVPDQTYRFVTSLLIHVGFVHWMMNSIGLYYLGNRIEKAINSLRFSFLFISTGIFGNMFGDCFALSTSPFSGYSSSLFGLIGFMYVDLIFHWKSIEHQIRCVIKLMSCTLLGFLYGLLPSVDSFSHVGGLVAGILIGCLLYPIDKSIRRKQKVFLSSIKLLCLFIYIALLAVLIRHFLYIN